MAKIALIGTSQLSFAGDKEGRYNKYAAELAEFLKPYEAELYVYPNQVIVAEDAKVALKACKAENPDFLLVQCTSFSAGFLAQVFATCDIPLGFWAIPEGEADNGPVLFNSFCSINMFNSIVRSYYPERRVPIKWFYGNIQDDMFAERMAITVRAIDAIAKMKKSKIALIGGIAPGFVDLYFDERKLLSRFPGMEFNRLHEFSEIHKRALSYTDAEVAQLAEEFEADAKKGVDKRNVRHHMLNARVLKAYRDFIKEYGYDAIAVSCWPKFQTELDYSVCSVVAQLNDEGIPTSCEGDVRSAVSMLMLNYITKKETMCMDMSAFDEADNTVLMWHCGPAAKCFAREEGYELGVNYSGWAHTPGEAPYGGGCARNMIFKPMKTTIGQVAFDNDKMLVVGGEFIDSDKPSYCGSRGWMGNLALAGEKISARDLVSTILDQGMSHHYAMAQGDVTNELMEIACWLDMEVIEKKAYKPYLQY